MDRPGAELDTMTVRVNDKDLVGTVRTDFAGHGLYTGGLQVLSPGSDIIDQQGKVISSVS